MGIDIYARWRDQSKEEESAQYTGFSITSGNVGYLREAYHGSPYATHYFVKEAFEDGEAKISAETLKARVPAAVLLAMLREQRLYSKKDPSIIDIEDAGDILGLVRNALKTAQGDEAETIAENFTPETLETARKLIATGAIPDVAKSYVDFAELCEKKEKETGEPCTIVASY